MKIFLTFFTTIALGLSGANAATYIVTRGLGAEDAWQTYLEANFTAASLGTINTGTYSGSGGSGAGAGDLIIFLRETDSGAYDEGTEVTVWNNSEANMLMLNSFSTRSSRFGWFNNDTTTGITPTGSETTVTAPADPLFNGVSVVGGMADIYTSPLASGDGGLQSQQGLVSGTALATSSGGDVILARIAAGSAWSSTVGGQSGTHGADRIYFAAPEDQDAGALDSFTSDGQTLLNNSLIELGLVAIPEPSAALLGGLGLLVLLRRRRA